MDSLLHFLVGAIIPIIIFLLLGKSNKTNSFLVCTYIFTATLGVAKEVYDWWDYGLFSLSDLVFTLLGISLTGVFYEIIYGHRRIS